MKPIRYGFTLIEVMAAVLILGLFVTVLSEMLVRASRFEGDTRQLAEAAAVADLEIAKLEEGLVRGASPALGKSESGEEPWRVTTAVTAFDATQLAGAAPPPNAEASPREDAGAALQGSWLASPAAQQNPPLLAIDVFVSWDGAPADAATGEPLGIHRRSYALNPAALESLPDAGGDGGDDEGGGFEDDGGADDAAAQLEDPT